MMTNRSDRGSAKPRGSQRFERDDVIREPTCGLHQGQQPYGAARTGRTHGCTRPVLIAKQKLLRRRGRPHMVNRKHGSGLPDCMHLLTVIAVADGADRGLDSGLGKSLTVFDRDVLAVAIGVMDETAAARRSAIVVPTGPSTSSGEPCLGPLTLRR